MNVKSQNIKFIKNNQKELYKKNDIISEEEEKKY
jgi:hypothetical protein